MGVEAILVMWSIACEQTFVSPTHGGSTWNLALIGHVVLEKIFDNGGQMDDWQTDGQKTDHGYTISSPMSLKAQVG